MFIFARIIGENNVLSIKHKFDGRKLENDEK